MFKIFPNYTMTISGDPIDFFLNIMTVFHAYQIKERNLSNDNSAICNPRCFAHSFFSLKMTENINCLQCNKVSENSYDNNYYVYEIYTWEILNYSKLKSFSEFNQKLFESIYNVSSIVDECIPFCNCPDKSLKARHIFLKGNPTYFLFHLTWDISNLSFNDVFKLLAMIPLSSLNSALFELPQDIKKIPYELKGIIAFYNGHYVSCIKSNKKNIWLFVDDMVKKEFNSYSQTIMYCVKNHYIPIALFYSRHLFSNMEEHITEKDYYSFTKELTNEKSQSILSNSLKISSMSNFTFASIKKSGIFNRSCSFSVVAENEKPILSSMNQYICTGCNEINPNNRIKCWKCKKVFTINQSEIQKEDHGWNMLKNESITGSTFSFGNNNISIKNINKYDILSQSNTSGLNETIIDLTETIPICQTEYNFYDNSEAKQHNEQQKAMVKNDKGRNEREIDLEVENAKKRIVFSTHNSQQSSIITSKNAELLYRPNESNLSKSSIHSIQSNKLNTKNDFNK